jgi:sulfopyruvate decarboxylase subunit beta
LLRFDATKVLLKHLTDEPVIPNLGPTADELWHAEDRDRNFYTYGSMGLCSSIALGMALSVPDKIISLDGDGSLLMNMGTIASIGRERPKNLIIVVWDNEMWGQTGGQATHTAFGTELDQVAKSCGITNTALVHDLEGLDEVFKRALIEDGPWFIVAKVDDPPEPFPLCPNEPEMTLYRFRRSFVGQEIPQH